MTSAWSKMKTYEKWLFPLLWIVAVLHIIVGGILMLMGTKKVNSVYDNGGQMMERKYYWKFWVGMAVLGLGVAVLVGSLSWFIYAIYKASKRLDTPTGELTVSNGPYLSINTDITTATTLIPHANYIDTYDTIYGKYGVRSYLKSGTEIDTSTYSKINWMDDKSYLIYDKTSVEPVGFTFEVPSQPSAKAGTFYEIVGTFYKSRDGTKLENPISSLKEIVIGRSSAEGVLDISESTDSEVNKLLK